MQRGAAVQPRRGAPFLAAAIAVLWAAPSFGEDVPAPPLPAAVAIQPAPPPVAPAPAPARVADRVVVLPSEKSADLQGHWSARRNYMRERDEHRADDEEQRVRALKDELGIQNLFVISAALVRESQEALAAGSPAGAVQRCKLAVEFAPALAEAHGCLARALLAEHPFAFQAAFHEIAAAASAASRDPRFSRAILANVLGVLFAGVLGAGVVFVLLLLLRYGMLYAHDMHHVFPAGARRWQTRTLAGLILLVPVFLQMGLVPLLFTALIACALYLTTAEAVVSIALLALLGASPWIARSIARVSSFGGPALDIWLLEQGAGTGPELQRLQKRFEAGNELAVDLALARHAKRDGELQAAEKIYLRSLDSQDGTALGLAAAHNNLGNVYLLEGETAKALAQYQQAIDIKETLAAPHFNISRALAMGGMDTLEKVQVEQARALELDRAAVEGFTAGALQASRRSNKFVMDVPLDAELLAPLIEAEEAVADPVADEARAALAAGLPAQLSWLLPLMAAAAVLGLQGARNRILPSGRCDRCGREVCRRCDSESRPNEALCAQCVNVFIRRTGVDPAERIRKEFAVERYHRRRKLLARGVAVISGAGHVLIGHSVRGLLFLVTTTSLIASVALWKGLVRDPVAVRSGLSFLRIGATAALFVALYALCARDLLARQRAEESA